MALYDWKGNFIEDTPDGQDYFLSEDGLEKMNEQGQQIDSNGNVAMGSWGNSSPVPPPAPRQWRPIELQPYRPPNLEIHRWRG